MVVATPYVALGVTILAADVSTTIGPAFWPAVISAVAAVVAVALGYINRRKINEVHVAVNSRLDEALGELSKAVVQIANLKRDVRYEKTQPAEVKNDAEMGHADDAGQ